MKTVKKSNFMEYIYSILLILLVISVFIKMGNDQKVMAILMKNHVGYEKQYIESIYCKKDTVLKVNGTDSNKNRYYYYYIKTDNGNEIVLNKEEVNLSGNLKDNEKPYLEYINIKKQNVEVQNVLYKHGGNSELLKKGYYNIRLYVPRNYEIKIIGDNEDEYTGFRTTYED